MNAIKTVPVESGNLAAIGYEAESKTLQVDFKTGKRFQYPNVPPELFAEFQAAESVGKFFAARIKSEFLGVPLKDDE
ncbi:MAG TPA: KTSC domain-containing protein [Blastocatellia bacterium]|nr:KTSC domain-containing protein [Blastocatellia bacterium]HMV81818.1 KTSC domain-containing protein [Blastocatellia bacterium]HMX24001.1 KTSC domain-containing protein [Blastocatellia bacterium]HMY70431.1 KTSC domain-containing protein [Blastocatellia bacterium]HMZ16506.1 KTSC domain-containing protein [Blastocatellia bacterium]